MQEDYRELPSTTVKTGAIAESAAVVLPAVVVPPHKLFNLCKDVLFTIARYAIGLDDIPNNTSNAFKRRNYPNPEQFFAAAKKFALPSAIELPSAGLVKFGRVMVTSVVGDEKTVVLTNVPGEVTKPINHPQ